MSNLHKSLYESNQINDSLNYNINKVHPLIQNSQEYTYYKKYVSIHSEDRDILKYPSSSLFEIELPEDMLNVAALRLSDWTFPANYNTFSYVNSNITMTFKINKPYNTNENNISNIYLQKVFEGLFYNQYNNYEITIEEGFYNPIQITTELTNKFNAAVTNYLINFFTEKSTNSELSYENQQEYVQSLQQLNENGGYSNFLIVYNNVSQKIWFGNTSDCFILTNDTQLSNNENINNFYCGVKSQLPDFSNWGLPANLGLTRCNTESLSGSTIKNELVQNLITSNLATYNNVTVPRFFYGDVTPGDNGYWLLPNPQLINSQVYWVECNNKINLMGQAYFYLEIDGQNCIDETSPYNCNEFTSTNNATNSIVNSSFAKIAIPTTPLAQWFDNNSLPYKYYYPAADRIRKFNIRLRYHNGLLVDFGVFNYSFTIEFTIKVPQILRSSNIQLYPPSIGN
jgi:hypothetical protein